MPKSVAIIYGFTEGEWHGKHFRKVLREQGYKVVKTAESADIVIAHSAGSFYIPKLGSKQLLLLVNPPYWPEKQLQQRTRDMIKQMVVAVRPGNQPFYHAHKTMHNFVYLARHGKLNRAITQMAPKFNLEDEIRHKNTILVRNSNDPWLTPHLEKLQQLNPHLRIERLSGDHDDLWLHPETYINLIATKK